MCSRKRLSIKELNDILNHNSTNNLGTFSAVDIAFIAGLLLDFEMKKDNGWNKYEVKYQLDDGIEGHEIRLVFQQYKEIYGVDWKDVFSKFSYAPKNQRSKKNILFSGFFAPIIFINKDTINYFFGQNQDANTTKLDRNTSAIKEGINMLKCIYIDNFTISNFIDKRTESYIQYEENFTNLEENIKKTLSISSPIFVFIFIIASTKDNLGKKNLKEKKIAYTEQNPFEYRQEYIEKLLLFAQDYERGLYELAKNIVEHSGKVRGNGKGMITVRAYQESEASVRILETHVFDYGTNGIVPKFIEYTNEKAEFSNISNERIRQCYIDDSNYLKNRKNYNLKHFIETGKNELRQQQFRHTSHYGINKLFNIIKTTLNSTDLPSEIYISSQGISTRDYYGDKSDTSTLQKGTHYYLKIPFIESNFKKIVSKPFYQNNQTAILGETASIAFLQKIKIKQIKLSELSGISEDTKDKLINITFDNNKITKENIDHIYNSLDKLANLDSNNIIAINVENKINDPSILLRFLAYLTCEYSQPFIVYNINYITYQELLKDNRDFCKSRDNNESYWHKERGILLFVKEEINDNESEKPQQFYFADILWGQTRGDFLFVNMKINKTFPNTIALLQEISDKLRDKDTNYQEKINSNQNLQHFFFPKSNNLLPFDSLLEDDGKPLFISNLKTILQNPLYNRSNKYKNLKEYIKNFEGFRIGRTHFKIGTKIHSEDFYYAKRLFQNSFYTARIAMLLAIDIKKHIGSNKIMLVGYEMYSELLLSLVEKFLKNLGLKQDIEHFIIQANDDSFKFLPNDVLKNYVDNYQTYTTIIIVPIAATGNTIKKIESDLREELIKNKKSELEVQKIIENYAFFDYHYNVILAEDCDEKFNTIKNKNKRQKSIITVSAKWHEIKTCPLCFGGSINQRGEKINTKTLFETDKTSLTPAIIFDNPIGKKLTPEEKALFDNVDFKESLRYKKVFRNNQHRIYYIDTDNFIKDNLSRIKVWLNNIKDELNLKSSEKVIIVAPCHESNSCLLNHINEFIFYSSATIIHYQHSVDFEENFKLLNKNYLTDKTKLFYVDDSLITGSHFFEISNILEDLKLHFHASIFLKNKSCSSINNRVQQLSNQKLYSFTNINYPLTFNILAERPLEYERQRYEVIADTVLHDVTIEIFKEKANRLNPLLILNTKKHENRSNIDNYYIDNNKEDVKKLRRFKNFEATHKIFDYFATNQNLKDYEIKSIVSFRDFPDNVPTLFPEYSEGQKKKIEKENQKALLKVLSQFPFNLYQPLREKTFDWLSAWIEAVETPNEEVFKSTDYDNFQTFKFLLRRAVLLGNYMVLDRNFFEIILHWFFKIDKYFKNTQKSPLSEDKENNLQDFPIYVLRNYIEMIQKNGWTAYKILKEILDNEFISKFYKSAQGSQFINMLQLEASLVIDNFYEMIIKERKREWRNVFRNYPTFVKKTDEIQDFFKQNNNSNILNSNKYQIVKETFLDNNWYEKDSPFINFLWIKQLFFVDGDKNLYFPKDVNYQEKIDAIIEKMIGLFPENKVQAFFVVTDGKQKPFVLIDKDGFLNLFNEEFDTDRELKKKEKEIAILKKEEYNEGKSKEIEIVKSTKEKLEFRQKEHRTQILIDFLNGIDCNTNIAPETTLEFYRDMSHAEVLNEFNKSFEGQLSNPSPINKDLFSQSSPNYYAAIWTNAYKKEVTELPFMPNDSKWLYLIRISERNGKGEYTPLGLLGFYSAENLYNSTDVLFSKQLLMLLRKDMGAFVERHHKNDEFSELIKQKEKADYQFMLGHGIKNYKDPIKNYFNRICELIPNKEDKSFLMLKKFYEFELEHLTRKVDFMSLFGKFDPNDINFFEGITMEQVVSAFEENFEITMKFERQGCYYLQEDHNFKDYIELYDKTKEWESDKHYKDIIKFPKNILHEMMFELIFNIRKHILNIYDRYITEDKTKKLKIWINFAKEDNVLYFKISNNYCAKKEEYFNSIYNKSKLDGLNLLNNILQKANIGKIKVTINENFKLEDSIINIFVPLKHL